MAVRVRDVVEGRLAEGEKLVRLEQPDPRYYKRTTVRQIRYLGFIFTAMALFVLAWAASRNFAPDPRSPYSLEFIAIGLVLGLSLIFLPPTLMRAAASARGYAITDRRVLSVYGLQVRSIEAGALNPRAYPYEDGTPAGDVNLDDELGFDSESTEKDFFVWYALRNARATEASLHNLARRAPRPAEDC
ncbi:MAG: hypothetical protein AB7G10_03515 [Reyranellaceae bacterium]